MKKDTSHFLFCFYFLVIPLYDLVVKRTTVLIVNPILWCYILGLV